MATEVATEARNIAGAITGMRVDELISSLAIGIAEGQMKLDQASMEIARFMSDAQVAFGKKPGSDDPDLLSMIELGFTPNFYQFVDTIIEVRVAVSSKFEESREYDTSATQFQSDEMQRQSAYESQSSTKDTGVSSASSSQSWSWGWWGGGSSQSSYRDTGVSSSSSASSSGSSSYKAKTLSLTAVDAKYASTYNYAVEASSLIKTKIVPVPPPTVFEETVRAKIEQRREWEKLMRFTDQVKTILPGLSRSAGAILADEARLPQSEKQAAGFTRAAAATLSDDINKLNEDYDALTTDHWAIIRSVQDREVTDKVLAAVLKNVEEILSAYPDESPGGTADYDAGAFFALIEAIRANLQRFKDKVDEILNRLSPPEEGSDSGSGGTTGGAP